MEMLSEIKHLSDGRRDSEENVKMIENARVRKNVKVMENATVRKNDVRANLALTFLSFRGSSRGIVSISSILYR
ncbi:hypothetical protein [Paenibacillus sp. sgz500958]|uniref:hypothetical protein n=1 Tax=Paenibacillus sp. sgz500958 TaxID=3242475 RepID=UPI0036D3AB61